MPIDNGVGLLAQVLMNQGAARRRAASQTAEMQQRQDLTDQGQEFQQQTMAAQLQAQARSQMLRQAQAAAAQEAQDARAEALDTRRFEREGMRDANRATREESNAKTRQSWEEQQKALDRANRLDEARIQAEAAGKPRTTHSYSHSDRPASQGDVRKTAEYTAAKMAERAYFSAKLALDNNVMLTPAQRAVADTQVKDLYTKMVTAHGALKNLQVPGGSTTTERTTGPGPVERVL